MKMQQVFRAEMATYCYRDLPTYYTGSYQNTNIDTHTHTHTHNSYRSKVNYNGAVRISLREFISTKAK